MATWEYVQRIATSLPEVEEGFTHDMRAWKVRDAVLAWERPLRRSDIEDLGAGAPTGPILAARVPDLEVKEQLLACEPRVYFTTPHFDGYNAILVRLPEIGTSELEELLTEAWLCRAPRRLARQWEAEHGNR
jgi:hypothetical protein